MLTPFHILTLKNATINQAHSSPPVTYGCVTFMCDGHMQVTSQKHSAHLRLRASSDLGCLLQDGNHAFIRLNFNFGPGYEPCAKFPGAICLKELSFRSSDPRHAQRV